MCSGRMMGIFGQPSVANLGEAKYPLNHPDAMCDLDTYLGLPEVFLRSTSSTTPRWRERLLVKCLARGACLGIVTP
jgi:hypothetical protein